MANTNPIAPSRRTLVPLALALLLLLLGLAPARAQVPDAEARSAQLIGQERSSRGIGGLAFAADLQAVARRHAQRMADRGEQYHNPDLASEVEGWQALGENVGVGSSADSLHQAFMGSPTHRAIILDPEFTEVGIGVVSQGGRLWIVQVFRLPAAATAQPASAPAPAPAPEPAPAPAPVPQAPASAPAPVPAPPPPPPPTTAAPPTQGPLAPVASPPPAPDEQAMGVTANRPGSQAAGLDVGVRATGAVVVPSVPTPVREVPPAAWAAAMALALTVAAQGLGLRRLGLVS